MPFPVTPVLDSFTRANAASIGGDWSSYMSSATDFGIISNQVYNPDTAYSGVIYDLASFGPNCEAYITIATYLPLEKFFTLGLRFKDIIADSWNFDGYTATIWKFDDGGTQYAYLSIRRVDNAVYTLLGSGVSISDQADGDKIGIRAQDSSLSLWYDNGSGWALKETVSDSTYSAAGYLSFSDSEETTARFDDFGGGNVSPIPVIIQHLRQQEIL